MSQFAHSLFLIHVALLFGASVVSAQVIASTRSDVTRIREFNRPTKTVKEWRTQVEAVSIQVTGVKVDRICAATLSKSSLKAVASK